MSSLLNSEPLSRSVGDDNSQNTDVASPCVRNCCLNDDDVCLGCGRTISEITAWHTADLATKKSILERSCARQAQLVPYFRR